MLKTFICEIRNPMPIIAILLACVGAVSRAEDATATKKEPPPPPYIFSLGGLSSGQIEDIKYVPGVLETEVRKDRLNVVWKPFNDDGPWFVPEKWLKGADRIYDFLAIKGRLGKTEWLRGGRGGANQGIILKMRASYGFTMIFQDYKGGYSEVMSISCYNEALPGQVEHEMLRHVPGTNVSIEKCGEGYVLVSRASRGTFVVWQINDQMFARIDNSFDKDMVAAYVNRLGSIIPKTYVIDADKWVEDEIRWLIQQVDDAYVWEKEHGKHFVYIFEPRVISIFPNVQWKFGILKGNESLSKNWAWMNSARNFLWANRRNLKYDDRTRGFLLKGARWTNAGHIGGIDLYDPATPPVLPEELRGPPAPDEAEEIASIELEVMSAIRDLNKQCGYVEKDQSTYRGGQIIDFAHRAAEIFPALKILGEPKEGSSLTIIWDWGVLCREFLWANRGNLRYDNAKGGFVLKSKSQYDHNSPPAIPEEFQGPQKPPMDETD